MALPPDVPAIVQPATSRDAAMLTTVDQIEPAGAGGQRTVQIAQPPAARGVGLVQLPPTRQPVRAEPTTGTGDPPLIERVPPPGLPDEVVRTWRTIQARGITPTPEGLVAELGPDAISRLFGSTGVSAAVVAALATLNATPTTPSAATPTGSTTMPQGITVTPGAR